MVLENNSIGSVGDGDFDSSSSSHKLENVETAVTMLESFVEGVKAQRYTAASYVELKGALDRVRLTLQTLPENVAMMENRLYDVEQMALRIAKFG